ncbi:uncharacterized protein LOC108221616 [Daucus carota subsp. sativus]|uniref:uncharacterized protein LOC108221616 n=1 Tax=Daucus carota subsp. sativus TaxID=79200 RepID=UPI0007EEFC1F|nr:PREDICTED: uncharacterized protein LOC108221616 [Daucus carota subsp. sativus]
MSLASEKVVLCELGGRKEIVRCFEDEDFKSSNADGTSFYNIVLEYADGGTLQQLIKSKGWILNMKLGVVKCNLKLADFGLAKKGGEKSLGAGEEYKNRGTLLYSSRNPLFGVHEAAMDIWAVNCIVLELLLGEDH